jgi:hypothetical protein
MLFQCACGATDDFEHDRLVAGGMTADQPLDQLGELG